MSLIMYNQTFLPLDENLRAEKGGKEKTGETSLPLSYSLSHGPSRFFTSHSRVTRVSRVSLAFRARLCAKNEAPEEEAVFLFFFK